MKKSIKDNVWFKRLWAPKEFEWWLVVILIFAAILRLSLLSTITPGITSNEAGAGLASVKLLHNGTVWLNDPYNALYSWLSAPVVAIGGQTAWAIRLVAALAGVLAVLGMYLWMTDWRGRRDGTLAALIIATMAWPVALGHIGDGFALVPAFVSMWLWLTGRVSRSLGWALACTITLAAMIYASPALWWFVGGVLLVCLFQLARRRWKISKKMAIATVVGAIVAAPGVIEALVHHPGFRHQLQLSGIVSNTVHVISNYFIAGGDWTLTVGSQPLLNPFYIIMATLGVLMCIVRRRSLGWLGLFWLGTILATAMVWTSVPETLALTLVPAVAVIVVGIGTLLEWWHATFPINSAARTLGRLAIGVVLLFAVYEGYVQFFVAYAGSSLTYIASQDDYTFTSRFAQRSPNAVLVVDNGSKTIITYLAPASTHNFQTPLSVKTEKLVATEYVISKDYEPAMLPILKQLVPGGVLHGHFSPFDGRVLYYDYKVGK